MKLHIFNKDPYSILHWFDPALAVQLMHELFYLFNFIVSDKNGDFM